MRKESLILIIMVSLMCLFISGEAWGDEFGILSETYVYPQGLRLDRDSQLFIWNQVNMDLSDDTTDKRERERSLKAVIPSQTWFGFGIIWDPDLNDNADPIDMSAYANGSLKFWFKTETALQVGIQDADGATPPIWLDLHEYLGIDPDDPEYNDNQWRFVSIPLNQPPFDEIDFSQVAQLFMAGSPFLKEPTDFNLTFHFDNVRYDTEEGGALSGIAVSPSPFTIPTGLKKGFIANGYDSNGATIDVYPGWSTSGITGGFDLGINPITSFTPTSGGTGGVSASYGGQTGSASVTVQDVTWNDFFNLFIEEGMYGNLSTYDGDDDVDGDGAPDDGDIIENNSIQLADPLVVDPVKGKVLKADYDIHSKGWAGLFIQEGGAVEPTDPKSLIVNANVEEGSGSTPTGWVTLGNGPSDTVEWATDSFESKTHSLKIVNASGNNIRWKSQTIDIPEPYPTKLSFSGWAKAENVSTSVTKFALIFHLIFKDGTVQNYSAGLNFAKGTHGWQRVEAAKDFGKPIAKIYALCTLRGGTGTAWFDNINAEEVKDVSLFEDGYLHFAVKTPVDLEVGLRSGNIPKIYEISKVMLSEYGVALNNTWQDAYIPLDDFKILDRRLDLTQTKVFFNVAVVGKRVSSLINTFYLDDIKYVREKAATPSLSVQIKKRSDNQIEPSGEIGWSTAGLGGGWEIADQYLEIAYETVDPSWGAQIYTDNLGTGASPKYDGDPTQSLFQQPAGLIGEGNRKVTCPMAWITLDDTNDNLPVPVEEDNGEPRNTPEFEIFFKSDTGGMWGTEEAKGEWCWLKDINSTEWKEDTNGNGRAEPGEIISNFSLTGDDYSTFINPVGIATGWYDPLDDSRVYILNPRSPVILYFAARFTVARELQRYRTNTITMELYHE